MMDDPPIDPQPSTHSPIPDQSQLDHSLNSTRDPVLKQLDAIIDNVTNHATPVLREIAARAAELAAKAGQAAGPMAQKAAERTGEVGERVASKSRAFASDLRAEAASPSASGDSNGASADDPVPAP